MENIEKNFILAPYKSTPIHISSRGNSNTNPQVGGFPDCWLDYLLVIIDFL